MSVCLLHCPSIRLPIRGSTKFDNCFQIGPSLRIHAPLVNINWTNTALQRTLRLWWQNYGTHTGKPVFTGASPCTSILYTVYRMPNPIARVASYPELRSLVPFGRIWVWFTLRGLFILTNYFAGFPQSLLANSGIVFFKYVTCRRYAWRK
jgi:hypothetical protein